MTGYCPKCNATLTVDELRADPVICPSCKAKLQVSLKGNWMYTALSVALASVTASLQNYASIAFGFWVLIYSAIILFLIKFYRWELHLPIRLIAVPDYRLWPED
jgi:hypothetical protein